MQNGGRPQGDPTQPTITAADAARRAGVSMPQPGPYDDILRTLPPSGRIESTFGPMDYILGALPIGRVLSPAAKASGKYLGLGKKAAPKAAFKPSDLGRRLLPNRADESLQFAADRAMKQGVREEAQNILNLQGKVDDILATATQNAKSTEERKIVGIVQDYFENLIKNPPPPSKKLQAHLDKLDDAFKKGDYEAFITDEIVGKYRSGDPMNFNLTAFPGEAGPQFSGRKYFDPQSDEAGQGLRDLMRGFAPTQNFFYNENGGKIGKKIKVLKKEGRPHDQAVAIALSMRDRNEL